MPSPEVMNALQTNALSDSAKNFLRDYVDIDALPDDLKSKYGPDIASGYEAARYLVGAKKPKEQTFYDDHPVQAVVGDALNKAWMPAVGVGAYGTFKNMRNSSEALKEFEKVKNQYEEPGADGKSKKHGPRKQDFEHGRFPISETVMQGEYRADPNDPSKYIMDGGTPPQPQVFASNKPQYGKPTEGEGAASALKQTISARGSKDNNLFKDKHVFGVEDPGMYGSSLDNVLEKYIGAMKNDEHFSGQGIADGMDRIKNPTQSHPLQHLNLPPEQKAQLQAALVHRLKDGTGDAAVRKGRLLSLAHQSSPLLAGGAIGLSGIAASKLMNLLQRVGYGKEKTDAWEDAARRTRGDFKPGE